MKTIQSLIILLLLGFPMLAQIRLDVAGDAQFDGRILIESGNQNVLIGKSAGNNLSSASGIGANVFIGVDAGRDGAEVSDNVYIGRAAGTRNLGDRNVMIGRTAGTGIFGSIFANDNVVIGHQAGRDMNGEQNIFIGTTAGGAFNNDGDRNVFIGFESGIANTTGDGNIFLGNEAGRSNTIGFDNIFLGNESGGNNTNGFNNIFLGSSTGANNSIGELNVFLGTSAGRDNVEGDENVYIGNSAGLNNDGSGNVFIGKLSGLNTTDAVSNTFVGNSSGLMNITGSANAFYGLNAGVNNTTGGFNTFVGPDAGENNTTGSFLSAFGNNASPSINNLQQSTVIGSHAIVSSSHSVALGSVATQRIQGHSNWGTLSDGRFKNKIRENVKGLDFIMQLRPITYQLKVKELDQFLRAPLGKISAVDTIESYQAALKAKSKLTYTGFIAQEVEQAATKSDFNFSGVVAPTHNNDHYTLRYAEFVVPLVKAMQEQQEIIEKQRNKLENLEERLARFETLSANNPISKSEITTYDPHRAHLTQSSPNPSSTQTQINYFIPIEAQQAMLVITDAKGNIIHQEAIASMGEGAVSLDVARWTNGTYYYSLIIDQQLISSKAMIVAH